MEIRWSQEAAADFAGIIHYIKQDNSDAALRVARTILGKLFNCRTVSRELLFPPLPFIVVYRVEESAVEVARMLPGARRWPNK